MDSKTQFRSPYLSIVGAMLLLVLLSLEQYAPSVATQYQSQRSPIIILEDSNENMTTAASSHANAITSSIAHETTTATNVPDVTLVEFVSSIEQIRGHLDQAFINKESGNNTLALAHSLHPIEEEVYSRIEDQLANQSNILNQTLSAVLRNLPSNVRDAVLEDFENQIDYANMLLNGSVQAVIPSLELNNNNPAFNASVVAQLLDLAEHEYEEAVSNSIIREIVEYQNAQAFIHRAESIFKSSASRINQSLAHEVEAVNAFFSILNSSVSNRDDPETIDATIHAIQHMLVEITGLSESQLIGKEEEEEQEGKTKLTSESFFQTIEDRDIMLNLRVGGGMAARMDRLAGLLKDIGSTDGQ